MHIKTITCLFHSLKYRNTLYFRVEQSYSFYHNAKKSFLWSVELVIMVGAMVGSQQTNCQLGLQGVMSPCFKLHDVWDIVWCWLHPSRSGGVKMLWSVCRNVRIWAGIYHLILRWWWKTQCILGIAHCNHPTMLARIIYNGTVAIEVSSCSFGLWEVEPSLINIDNV